jgi:predicted esterase
MPPRVTLLGFHGFTLNGAQMRAQLSALADALGSDVDLVCPDAPHECSQASLDALYPPPHAPRSPAPYLRWWSASDDGLVYEGWEATRESVREWLVRYSPVGVIGFSQGGILAAAVAALAAAGELPPIRCAVLIAGRTPRASVLQPVLSEPIRVPSLHVWGDRDQMAPIGPALAERFDATTREVCTWSGGHSIPDHGPAHEAMVTFVRRHADSASG